MFRFTTSTTTRTPRPCPLAFLFCILLVLISARLSLALPGDAEGPTFISIPLVRTQSSLPTTTSNGSVYTHGSVVQQQHANRALKRFAVMTGRTPPSEYELLLKIYERIILLSTPKQRVHEIKQIEEILAKLLKATQHTHTVGKSTSTGISAGTSAGQALPTGVEAAVITTRPQARTWSSREPRNTCGGRGRFDKRSNAARQTPINSTYRDIGLSIESNDYGYMVVMKMGSPPKTFNLLVDSGSSDLWVGAEGCQGDDGGSCGKHNFLGPHSSTTFKQSNESWAIGYVSGTVDGYLVTDDVSIAGLRLPGHRFGVATSESDSFTPDYIPFDGLLGLGKESLSQQRVPTLLQSLFQAKLIPSAVVSYRLPRLADRQNNGIMTIGGMDPKLYISKTLVVKKNVNKFGYWGVNVDSVKVGTRGMGWSNRTVVMDTGTTLILAPQHDVDAIHANIPGAVSDGSGWRVPCNMTTVISLTIGGQAFAIDPRDIAFYPVEAGSTMCMSGIAVGGVGPFYLNTEWLVGDVFLKNVYFSTDDTKDVISIALPKK